MPAGVCARAGAAKSEKNAAAAPAARLRPAVISASPCVDARGALLPAPPLLAKSHLLGELRAGGGVVRRHHRVVGRQAPFFAVLLRCDVVLRAQVALERLELL